jgi:DNA polymerase-3 subunit epsilon
VGGFLLQACENHRGTQQETASRMSRIVALDTETTGISHRLGHRVIEIGAVELIDGQLTGRQFHTYLQPQRRVDWGAQRVHGISDAMLVGKPLFSSKAAELLEFLRGSEMVAHNATFDVGFLDNELRLSGIPGTLAQHCRITCSLKLARGRWPGQGNKLDDVLQRLRIPSQRGLHGALKDAHLLAQVIPHLR